MSDVHKTTDKILGQQLTHIRELLNKVNVVVSLAHSQVQQRGDILENLARHQVLAELKSWVQRLHAADIAYLITNLSPDERLLLWHQIRPARAGDVLLELDETVREQIIGLTNETDLLAILEHLDADDLAYLSDEVPQGILEQALKTFTETERQFFAESVTHSEDSVGHLMTPTFVSVRDNQTLEQVLLSLRGLEEYPSHLDKLFVLDQRGVFRGLLPIQILLRNSPEKRVHDLLVTDAVIFHPNDNARDAVQAFERYDLISAPVLNDRGKLIGRLTVDDIMDYQHNKADEEMLALAGLSRQEDLFATIREGVRNRSVWLMINVFTALIASRVIGAFEGTIAHVVALATLMPIVASVGGNTGNQTTALMIRFLGLGQLDRRNMRLMARKELGITIVIGLLLGSVGGLFAYLIYFNLKLAMVLGLAMLLNLLIASVVGMTVPLSLHKFGRDPALGSSILLTATTDSMGFFIFLGLATLFLI
ncbi:MAG: magnesium transporter [Gammaproteobacteria bacterium]|nr:magnesium transporter [Gammaproteobacteria bacterium]